jgi:hypothetical protein
LPFDGVTNVTDSLPITLVLYLGLVGAEAYFIFDNNVEKNNLFKFWR